jgi:tetratricopeptide (TPR) repeat protein
MIVAPKALINYLSNMIFPWTLSPFYPYPQDPSFFSPEYLFPIAFTIGFTVFCIAIAKKERLWPAVWAYYIITLLPVIGIVQVGIQAMADRYAYLPSLAPFLLVGLAVTWLAGKVSAIKKGVIGPRLFAAAAVILLLGPATYLTVKQITVWKDDFVLWNYIIERAPERVYFAYMNRGIVYSQMEQFDKAIDDYNIAAALNQSDSQIFVNRGQAYLALGRIQPAIRDFNKACELGDSFGCAAPQYIK